MIPQKFSNVYILFENDDALLKRFFNDGQNKCLLTTSKITDDLKLNGENIISVDNLFDDSFFELNYQEKASHFLDNILKDFNSDLDNPLIIDNISIFDSNSGIIMLYYLQKGCKNEDMAASLLDRYSVNKVVIGSLRNDMTSSIYFECTKRGIEVEVISAMWQTRTRITKIVKYFIWFANEALNSLLSILRRKVIKKNKIMFFCKGIKFHDAIVPVIKEIISKNSEQIVVITKGEIPGSMKVGHLQVQYFNLHSFRNFSYLIKLFYQSLKVSEYWSRKIKYLSTTPARAGSLYSGYLLHVLNDWFQNSVYRSIRVLLLSDRILDKFQPAIIVVTDPTDFEAKTLTMMGKTKNVPSFCIQYGAASKYDSEWKYFKQDYVGVMGEEIAEIMRSHGIPQEKVYIMGSPRFDSYTANETLRQDLRHRLDILKPDAMIAFMSVPPAEGIGRREGGLTIDEYEYILSMIYDIPSFLPETVLVVKPHPEELEYIQVHRKYLEANAHQKDRVRLVQNNSAYEVINAADLVITMQSTTGLEAILLNKPLIMINITGREDWVNYASSGAAYRVASKEELAVAIKELLTNNETAAHYEKMRLEYLKRNLSFIHAGSARSADIIFSLIDKGKNI